jgi:N6-L-threonylcarbamoyladenine synthase
MKILGIETSCDETACAVVEDGTKVLANELFSQIDLHAETGGVVPEVAAREHVLKMIPVLDKVLAKVGDVDAIAVTKGPGLISSLIIGTTTASVISQVRKKPIIPIHHIEGHIYSNWLERTDDPPKFPALILTVSGGHNELYLMRDHGDLKLLGETRDDAAGEAFDKVARLLGLGYPGGPAISKIASEGDREKFALPRSYLEKGSFDFSFSGLKTAVLNLVKENELTPEFVADCAASFQEAVCEVLSDKLLAALQKFNPTEVHLAGGVSANTRLRELIQQKIPTDITFRHPVKMKYCTDNAAMIASAGYFKRDLAKVGNVTPDPNF